MTCGKVAGADDRAWRRNDGTPQFGRVEYRDRAMRTGTGNGGSMTWALLGHSDDIVAWRPAPPRGYRTDRGEI